MNEPIETSVTVPVHSQRRRTQRWWIAAGISFISLGLLVMMGFAALDYMYNVWPQESYRKIYEKPWLQANVRALKFQSTTDFGQAEGLLLKSATEKSHEDSPIPHFLLAELYNTQGHPEKAVPEYRKTIRVSQKNWLSSIEYQEFSDNAHAALAILAYEQNRPEKARQELADIAASDENREADILTAMQDSLDEPERGDFHLLLGKAFRKALKFKMANQELHKAVQLSQNPQVRMEANSYLKSQMPQGVQELSPLARYYGLAARAAQTNDENLPKAAALFKKALVEAPKFDWGYNELAIIYREMKDYPAAIAYARNAIHQNTDFYNPYLTLGDIALDQADYPTAISHFSEAESILQRLPQEEEQQQGLVANIENQIAYAYEAQHQYQAATQHYQSALSISAEAGDEASDDYDYAREGLARLAKAQQEPDTKTASTNNKQLSWKP